ncbi:uncharacterized protein [Saccopteryx bilineata]|uniref:uncharacterized protein n=1 Tax=Saccopteryx bilineata TaxID=59482 RepID=UPI00338E1514
MSSRNQQSSGGRVRLPISLHVPPGPAASGVYTHGSTGPPAPSAPLLSVQHDCPPPLAQPEEGLRRLRRHVPKETAGSQCLTGALGPPANQLCRPRVRPSGWPIPKSVRPLMPAPRFRVHPIRKGVVRRLLLEGRAEGSQVSGTGAPGSLLRDPCSGSPLGGRISPSAAFSTAASRTRRHRKMADRLNYSPETSRWCGLRNAKSCCLGK